MILSRMEFLVGTAEKGGDCFHTSFAAGPARLMPVSLFCQMAADRGDDRALVA